MPRSSPPASSQNESVDDTTANSSATLQSRSTDARRCEPSNQPSSPPHHQNVAQSRRSSSFSSPTSTSNNNTNIDVAATPMSSSQRRQPQDASPTDATTMMIATAAPTRPLLSLTATLAANALANAGRKRPSIEKTECERSKKQTRVRLEPLEVPLHTVSGNLTRKSRRKSDKNATEATDPAANCSAPAVTPTPTRLELGGAVPFDSETKENHDSPSSSSSSSSTTSSSKSQLSTTNHPVPEGVIQLYPPRRSIAHLHCQCHQNDHCSPDSYTHSYVLSYGWEHSQLLRRSEGFSNHCSLPLLAKRRSSESSSSNHSQNSETSYSHYSEATPSLGVNWVIQAKHLRPPIDNDSASSAADDGDYMARQPDLTPRMRGILIDWLVELSEEYNLSHASLHLAITLVDKTLASGPLEEDGDGGLKAGLLVSRIMLQCLGCVCLWIATKIEEKEPPSLDDFVYISDNTYTRQDITSMEMSVCAALRFRLWQVTPYQFVYEFLRASHACSNPACLPTSHHHVFRNMVHYLMEIARVPYELANRSPSLITAAAIYLARATLGLRDASADAISNGIWTPTLHHYTGYSVDQLKETVNLIHQQHRLAGEASLKQVHAKFGKEKYFKVSLKTALNVEDLGF